VLGTRRGAEVQLDALHARAAGLARLCRREGAGAQQQHDGLPTGEVELGDQLLTVGAAPHERTVPAPRSPCHVAGEAEPAARRERGGEAERVDRVPGQHERRPATFDQRLHGGLRHVRLELGLRRGHDEHVLHARQADGRDVPLGVCADQRDRHRPRALLGESARGPDQLERHRAQLAAPYLRDDDDPAHDPAPSPVRERLTRSSPP
jgi:hypothetical protein